MLNKIINQLEEAKYCKHDFYQNGIDQAISIIKAHESEFDRHPLSDEDIERAAKGFRKEHLFSTSFTADVRSFTEGANFAKQPHSNEWVKVEDVKKYLTEQEKHSLEMCKVAKDNRDIFLEGISTGECVAFSLVSAFLTRLKNKI